MSQTVSRQGGANSWQTGNLKRPLPVINVYTLGAWSGAEGAPVRNARCWLRGLSPNMCVSINGGLISENSRDQLVYPALPGKMKVTPFIMTASGDVMFLKPLTLAAEVLPASLAMGPGIPIGQNASNFPNNTSLADGALIEFEIDPAEYATSNLIANVALAITAWYTGPWWDVEAISKLIASVTVDGPEKPIQIFTGGI